MTFDTRCSQRPHGCQLERLSACSLEAAIEQVMANKRQTLMEIRIAS
ncbi:hypothetical protein ACK83U_21140 (plasmid) [Rhizobium sp. WW22]|nr:MULTISPECIES: hypothetical protein [unclassified Rhizobium]MBB3383337.1 hypothetical protein [Rhizobium sp. BK098]MBB3615358.1 hypothetical protein [Rhizobium sp. BK609]MBB3681018.1 hypothetical protein [Rhizobium sp. BK612]